MKKFLFAIMMMLTVFVASAETYRVTFDAQTRRETNFIVNVQHQSGVITINGVQYSYKAYGSIYNQGYNMTFVSGAY